jgi:hypothetical protein
VVEGSVRARQERRGDAAGDKVMPVLIHGDSAFAGQGVIMETLQMSQARAFYTGGTVHIIINNQVGFTTHDPRDTRSTLYCSDVAKMVDDLVDMCGVYGIEWERSEQTVFNSEVGYAGTMDGIITIQFPGETERRRCVADIKTSRSANKAEYALQLAALKYGATIVHDDGSEEPMPETDEIGVILWVRPEQDPQILPAVLDETTFQHFKFCVAMAYAEKVADDRVLFLPPLGDPTDDTKLLTEREVSSNE